MAKAAIPNYMTKHLTGQDIAPGHHFGLYFPIWQDDWGRTESGKKDALKTVAKSLPESSIKLAKNLHQRQLTIAVKTPHLACFPATSISPFMTGIGNEHPLENGFAFLNPYGLPYLPGSSVKGVLCTAAEELALGLYGETAGWDMLAVWWLFGFEAGSSMFKNKRYKIDVLDEEAEHCQQAFQKWLEESRYDKDSLALFVKAGMDKKEYLEQPEKFLRDLTDKEALRETISNQGALSFWDVYPQSKNLAMDILTPHHGGYFNGENAPHDSEQPNPNVFLTIPPDSRFDFYCACKTARLPPKLQQDWQNLIEAAFEHTFDWLGFGAKTAVGYGQMHLDKSLVDKFHQQARSQAKENEEAKRLAELPPIERGIQQLLKDNKDPNKKPYLVLLEAVKANHWPEDDRSQVLRKIQLMMQELGDWRPETQKKDPSKDKAHQRTLEILNLLGKQ